MICWITDRLGTAPATSVHLEPGMRIVDVRELVDKEGNEAANVKPLIDAGVAALNDGDRVVVCCDYGISRSNAVAAGILALVPFEINPRFSASTFLRALAGFNEIDSFLCYETTGAVDPVPTLREGWYLRSFTERFVPEPEVKQ